MDITERIKKASFSIPIIQTILAIITICKNIGIELNWFNKLFPNISIQLLGLKAVWTILWVSCAIGIPIILATIIISIITTLYGD